MKASSKCIAAIVFVSLASGFVNAQNVNITGELSKLEWVVTKTSCPIGCSQFTQKFLNSLTGSKVNIGAIKLSSSFIDDCDGKLISMISPKSVNQIVDSVNLGVAPNHRKLSVSDMGIKQDTTESGFVFCRTANGDNPLIQFLSVEHDRLLILFEEQSIIELR